MADEKNLNEEEEMTVTLEILFWITLWMMMNTRSLQMHLTKC